MGRIARRGHKLQGEGPLLVLVGGGGNGRVGRELLNGTGENYFSVACFPRVDILIDIRTACVTYSQG